MNDLETPPAVTAERPTPPVLPGPERPVPTGLVVLGAEDAGSCADGSCA